MITIEKVDPHNKSQVDRFVRLQPRLYEGHPQYVPPFISDIKTMLDRKKHPFYDHSDAEFFIAVRDGKDAGRIAALENKPFNQYHGVKDAEFYLFDCEDDQDVANALFNHVFEWARNRGLNHVVGPKGFSAFDGYGIQIEGFEGRQMMNMMNYNYPYYVRLVETIGFTKAVDFVSCYINPRDFHVPEKMGRALELVKKRSSFEVIQFKNKKEMIRWVKPLGFAYNKTFVNNWEYYPLTEREVQFVLDNLMTVAIPKFIKLIARKTEVVGFLLAFPDVSAAMQRGKGKLNPLSIADLLIEVKRTKWISLNGVGVLPEYQGLGGNALMYAELQKTLNEDGQFDHAELTQMAETAMQVRKDIITAGSRPYKNHRVFQINI